VVMIVGGGGGGISPKNISAGLQLLHSAHGGDQWGEEWVVVMIVGGGCGEIAPQGGISPKNPISSLMGSISVLGAIDSQCAWGRPVG
jgi:hypothetical protein